MRLFKKHKTLCGGHILRCLKWGWMPRWMLNVNNRTPFPTISYNVSLTPVLHSESDQPVRMCSWISVFDISFMKMTITSANFFTMMRQWLSPAHISYKANLQTCPNSCNKMNAKRWACFPLYKRTTMFLSRWDETVRTG